jgi:hypothetical protein
MLLLAGDSTQSHNMVTGFLQPAREKVHQEDRSYRAISMAQVVECLPSKCKGLSSNPSTVGKKSNL